MSQPATTNIRPLAIFSSYMLLASTLTGIAIRTILRKANPTSASNLSKQANFQSKSKNIFLFAILATLSLATTWFYMFSFFAFSYNSWADSQTFHPINLELGNWLHDSKLFKEAWGTACATPERNWWTQQIFLFTTLWSLILGREGGRRNIPNLWVFMLLGQVVAISFASNLFFLAILCSPPSKSLGGKLEEKKKIFLKVFLTLSIAFTFICIHFVPTTIGTPYFLPILMVPHILLFVPIYSQKGTGSSRNLAVSVLCAAGVLQAKTTRDVLNSSRSLDVIPKALYEHPAVSSVGWDVILCWLSFGLWTVLEGW